MQNRLFNTSKALDINAENNLASNILQEAISNNQIKYVLCKIASEIKIKILEPLQQDVNRNTVKSINDLALYAKKSIDILAIQNITDEQPFGAVLEGYAKAEYITNSMDNIKRLLYVFDQLFSNVNQIDNLTEIRKLLKSIADLSFCYFEYFNDHHSLAFYKTKDFIWLTPEEQDARILRKEIGEEKVLALTFGISTERDVDLVPASRGIGMNSGEVHICRSKHAS